MNIHFAACACLALFASKETFARIDFLRQDGRLVVGKGTQNVKILAEKQTKAIAPCMPIGVKSKDKLDMCKLAHKAIST